MGLLGQSVVNLSVRFADHSAHRTLEEFLLGVGPPGGRNGTVAAAHGSFKLFILNLLVQVVGKVGFEAFVYEADVSEAECENDVVVKLDEILNSQEDCLEGVLNNILAHLAAGGNGDGVSVDHAETFLEDALL